MRTWILISGQQGAGKTTAANQITARLQKLGFGVQRISLADPIRECASQAMLTLGYQPTPDQYGRLLQLIGQWGREVSENFWVERLLAKLRSLPTMQHFIIIDDARYPNELENLKLYENDNVIKIRLWAPESIRQNRALKWRPTKHESETGLDAYPLNNFHAVIGTDITTPTETMETILNLIALHDNAVRVAIQQSNIELRAVDGNA